MVDRIGPVNAVAGAPQYDGRWERQLRSVHQAMGSASRPLGARTGVRPGTPVTTVTATSTAWTCQAFAGEADVEAAAEAGAYPFSFDAVATGAMTPADGSNPRTDIVYVQIDDPSEDGSSVPAVTRKYFAGVAGSGVAPVPPVTRAFVIAQINVPKSGTGSPSVTWVAPYTAGAGGVVPFLTKAQLDLWTTAPPSQHADVFADGTARNNGQYTWDVATSMWRKSSAFAMMIDVATTLGAGGGSSSAPIFWGGVESVTFPVGLFTVAPAVQLTMLDSLGAIQWPQFLAATTTGFTYRLIRVAGAPNVGSKVRWEAKQMTPTSAEG